MAAEIRGDQEEEKRVEKEEKRKEYRDKEIRIVGLEQEPLKMPLRSQVLLDKEESRGLAFSRKRRIAKKNNEIHHENDEE